ncbi:MAG: cytochrome c oxidase subunit II [Pseudomonadales bacterium]|nr:cytochrome c oxidase subunit II [Pseudomonadales bacterium]RZV53102.1 MAG: cytochrome c oxidase subunit II [Pseudomonadales bacterium]
MRLLTKQPARKRLSGLCQFTLLPALLAFSAPLLAARDAAVNEAQRWQVNMPEGVTAVSREVFGLHMLIFWICVVIGVVVFGVMFWSMLMHRKSTGFKPSSFHESTAVEIAWTVVPFVILVLMAIPATSSLIKIYDTSEADLDIKVVGYQWKWQYEYLEDGVSFFSNLSTSQDEIYGRAPRGEHYLLEVDEPLVIPVNKKVRFLITASDVLHAWWVPDLAVKRDAIPGFINDAWAIVEEPGIYRGQCAELCGKNHGFMPIVVHAMEEQDYNEWMAGKKQAAAEVAEMNKLQLSMDEMYARGEGVYNRSCAACHGVDGKGGVGPSMIGTAVTTGPMQKHVDVIVNGVQGTAMQAFGNQLSELDLAAVVTYERNAWGNNMGDMVQAVDVLNFKKGQ